MDITAVRPQKRRRDRVNVCLGNAHQVALSAEVAVRAGLRAGISISDEDLARLLAEDSEIRAKEVALRLLGYRPRSREELRQRLIRAEFPASIVDACLVRLDQAGLLDDSAFASAYVRDRVRSRPIGIAGLKSRLRAYGIDPSEASAAVSNELAGNGISEDDLAIQAVRKFRVKKGEENNATLRRLYGYLGRRGFSAETIARQLESWRSPPTAAVGEDD